MNQQEQTNQQEAKAEVQGLIADAKAYLNEERGTLTHVVTDDIRIVLPINLYKKILGIAYTPAPKETAPVRRANSYGLQARPVIYLSKDGRYLVHRVLGMRISKHINFYRKVLGAEFTPDIRASKPA